MKRWELRRCDTRLVDDRLEVERLLEAGWEPVPVAQHYVYFRRQVGWVRCGSETTIKETEYQCVRREGHEGKHRCGNYRWEEPPTIEDTRCTSLNPLYAISPRCTKEAGHEGRHTNSGLSWTGSAKHAAIFEDCPKPQCNETLLGRRCRLPLGHEGMHEDNTVTWPRPAWPLNPSEDFVTVSAKVPRCEETTSPMGPGRSNSIRCTLPRAHVGSHWFDFGPGEKQ